MTIGSDFSFVSSELDGLSDDIKPINKLFTVGVME